MELADSVTRTRDVDVSGGSLRVLSYGDGPQHVLAVHGITANASCWRSVARELPPQWTLHAVDLRGRGHSAALPGPYGFDRHAADLADTVRGMGLERPVLAGHSLGAYVALITADAYPDLFSRLVLLDGGLPLPPVDADVDHVLSVTLGPAIARLSQTYATAEAYVDFWRAHPALAADWNDDIEQYVRYDLTGEPGSLRSRVVPECARADGRDLLTSGDRFGTALRHRTDPTPLLRSPRGLFGEPPGMLSEETAAYWQEQAPCLRISTLADTNHYTMMFLPAAAARIASVLAGEAC